VARLPARPRHVRATPARRRVDGSRQDPPGDPRRGAAARPRRSGRDVLARLRPRDDAPERAVPLRPPPRRGEGDARARGGGAHHARGLRQLGPQRDGLPVGGRRQGRGLRRDAVRGGAHPLLPAPPPELFPPSEVQDRVRRLRGRPRLHRDQRHRLAGADRRGPPRLPGDRGRRNVHPLPHRRCALRLPPCGRGAHRRGGDRARLPPAGRLQAQAAQPDEVPDQGAGMGPLEGGARRNARGRPRRRRRSPSLRRR
jgi:hypothetical protein